MMGSTCTKHRYFKTPGGLQTALPCSSTIYSMSATPFPTDSTGVTALQHALAAQTLKSAESLVAASVTRLHTRCPCRQHRRQRAEGVRRQHLAPGGGPALADAV